MTEEVKKEEAKDLDPKDVTQVELSPHEEKALEQGWVPKDEWQGDPDEWRPAKEFVERGELFKSIHSTKRELKQTQAALNAQVRHHQFVFQKAHEQAMKDLRLEKRAAMKEQDFDKLEEVETRIEELQSNHVQEAAQMAQVQQAAQQQVVAPEFQEFLGRNTWYETDRELRLEADIVAGHFVAGGGPKDQLFSYVEKEVKRRNPEKFGVAPQKRAAPAAVAGVNRVGKPTKEVSSMNDVPEHMRDVIKNFTEASGLSQADYIKELKRIGAF